MSEIRYNALKDRYVIVASKRAIRPNHYKRVLQEDVEDSPFVYGNEHLTPSELFAIREGGHKDGEGWRVRVVPNLFNALSIESDYRSYREGFFEGYGAFGAHEVVIETPDKTQRPKDFSTSQILDILRAYQARISDLRSDERIKYITLFKNHGREAGATIRHQHSQVIALPFVPKYAREELAIQRDYFAKHKRALLDDIISEEGRAKERVLFENDNFFAFCPYASLFPFEVNIIAKNPFADISIADEFAMKNLALSLKRIYKAYAKIDRDVAFNVNYKMLPINSELATQEQRGGRFYVELTPRIYNLAGFELGSGEMMNPVEPEVAAKFIREHYE